MSRLTSPAGVTRRRFERVRTVGRCFARLGDGWEGSVIDLSLCGMLLRLRKGLTPGSSYFVKLLFKDQEAVVEAKVVRLEPDDDDYLAGMEFVVVSPQDAVLLQKFIRVGKERASLG